MSSLAAKLKRFVRPTSAALLSPSALGTSLGVARIPTLKLKLAVGGESGRAARLFKLFGLALAGGILALPAVLYAVQVVVATTLIWTAGAVLSSVNLYWFWLRLKDRAASDEALRDVVLIEVNEGKFAWRLDKSKVAEYGRHDRLLPAGAVVTCLVVILLVTYHHGTGHLASVVLDLGFTFYRVPDLLSAVFAALLSAGVLAFVHVRVDFQGPLTALFEGRARPTLERIRAAVDQAGQEIDVVVKSIRQLAADLEIHLVAGYPSELAGLLRSHLVDGWDQEGTVRESLQHIQDEAIRERNELQKAHELHKAADTLFGQVAPAVNGTGLMPLIRDLDAQYRRLTSPQLKAFLENKQWTDYQHTVQAIANAMNRLRDLTEQQHREQQQREERQKQEERKAKPDPAPPRPPTAAAPPDETKEQRAYRILGLPERATREHIQKAYRWLSSVWHPDRGIAGSDDQMKEINWAYEYLKKYRTLRSSPTR